VEVSVGISLERFASLHPDDDLGESEAVGHMLVDHYERLRAHRENKIAPGTCVASQWPLQVFRKTEQNVLVIRPAESPVSGMVETSAFLAEYATTHDELRVVGGIVTLKDVPGVFLAESFQISASPS
jgi:hypothetical protein